MDWMTMQFEIYGNWILFLGLFAESMAVPFPGELAMAVAGHLIVRYGGSSLWMVMLISFLGATIGTCLTFVLGRLLGVPFFERYGKYVLMNQERMDKLTLWFDKYGNKLLLVSYFVPGLRHFTGYASGILKIRPATFLLYSNLSALVWVPFYVMAGYVLGNQLEKALQLFSSKAWIGAAIVVVVVSLVIIIRKRRAELLKKKRVPAASQSRGTE